MVDVRADSPATRDTAEASWGALTWSAFLALSATFLAYLTIYGLHRQRLVLLGAVLFVLLLSAILWIGRRKPRGRLNRMSNVERPMIVLSILCFGLLAAAMLWAHLFIDYSAGTGFTGGIFRGVFARPSAPLYGTPDRSLHWFKVLTLASALVALIVVARLPAGGLRPLRFPRPSLCLVHLLLIVSFGLADPQRPLLRPVHAQQRFQAQAETFAGIGDVLATYVDRMSALSHDTWHYPPGMTMLFKTEQTLGLPGFVKTLLILATVLTAFPLVALVRELELPPRLGLTAHALLAVCAAPIVFSSMACTSLLMLLAATALWLAARVLRTGAWPESVLLGLTMAACTLFSFSVAFVGVVLGLVCAMALVQRACPLRHTLRLVALSLVAYVAVFAILRAVWGFDLVRCLAIATANNYEVMGPAPFLGTPIRYLFTASGNLLAYAVAVGLPLSALALMATARALRRSPATGSRRRQVFGGPLARAFVLGSVLGLLPSAFSGVFFLETERLWLFFVPGTVLAAAVGLSLLDQQSENGFLLPVAAVTLCLGCAYGLAFKPYIL